MKTLDTGGALRIVVENFSYGVDQVLYQDAVNSGVLLAVDDGQDDGDQNVDTYLIPTWGDGDTVQDVIARYFPSQLDTNGNVVAIATPEYVQSRPAWCQKPAAPYDTLTSPVWCNHILSTADWWNIYLNNLGDGTAALKDTPAKPGATAFFPFQPRLRPRRLQRPHRAGLGTDPRNPASHPRPELLAGLTNYPGPNNTVTSILSLQNTGPYDAYGVEAVMIAPDDSVSITNNTVGGSGRVKALKQVIVGSHVKAQDPLPFVWTQKGHAGPSAGGYFTGSQDKTYTFTVRCSNPGGCDVGSDTNGTPWTVLWNDGAGGSGQLNSVRATKCPSRSTGPRACRSPC